MITMKDIAREAGVSQPTVSVVLNDKASTVRIGEETRRKILETAERLGYRRNEVARSIRTGKTSVIAVIGNLDGSYCMETIKGISDAADERGYSIKIKSVTTVEETLRAARNCISYRVAGIVCRNMSEEQLQVLNKELGENKIPIVLLDSCFPVEKCSRVVSDDADGIRQIVEYLGGLGHRNILHVTNSLQNSYANTRCRVFVDEMRRHGLSSQIEDACIISMKDDFDESCGEMLKRIAAERPTAVFCVNDMAALKVILAVNKLGLKVPDDISVVGYAGLNYTAYTVPPLTTVLQPFQDMGRTAFNRLYEQVQNPGDVKEIRLPVHLVIRESAASPKIDS
ncbi:MAG: LacI family transcriptional regulator [Lentisphaerae bacterium]|nr:LacI family transcriptional regulator [Lentisphaerota bacterium]MCP4102843.1 LacI family transcriptional regulator [Lentisphaerota bacterium]